MTRNYSRNTFLRQTPNKILKGGITESCGWTDEESGVSLW
jgi:hypothetical protein